MDELHAPLIPLLTALLADPAVPQNGLVLDLACGDCAKWPLYRTSLGPNLRLLGLDRDRHVLPTSAVLCGDATALPFTAASFDGLLCVAALGLFDEPQRVLAEIRRVLKPGATLLFVTAERRWAQVMRWPAAVAERIAPLLPLRTASPDLTGDLEALLASAGLIELRSRAMLLEPGVSADLSELALLPAAQIAALFPALSQSDRDACAAALADIEIELCSVVLAVCAQNPANEAPQIRIPSSQLIHKLLLG